TLAVADRALAPELVIEVGARCHRLGLERLQAGSAVLARHHLRHVVVLDVEHARASDLGLTERLERVTRLTDVVGRNGRATRSDERDKEASGARHTARKAIPASPRWRSEIRWPPGQPPASLVI